MKTYKIWSTAADASVCLQCAMLEGSAVPVGSKFRLNGKAVADPPMHGGCRCALCYEEAQFLEPQLKRDFKSLQAFSALANDSDVFHGAVVGYYASVHFLRRLTAASPSQLRAAGLVFPVGYDLKAQLSLLEENKEKLFSQALTRAYGYVVKNSQKLKTVRGKMNRLQRFREEVLEDSVLLPQSTLDALDRVVPAQVQ